MNKTLTLKALFILLLVSPIYAQQTQPTPPAEPEEEVVKISTKLVQMDAVVTDKDGNPVTNLTAEDFEIFQDGKPQEITGISYISRSANTAANPNPVKGKKKSKLPPIVYRQSLEEGRLIAFIVDDGNCAATFSGIGYIRVGLEDFIKKRMAPHDLVAIYRTRDGSSLLQQYTSNKAQLLRSVRKIRWFPTGGSFCASGDEIQFNRNVSSAADRGAGSPVSDLFEDQRETPLTGVTRYALNGLRKVSGRKILFLMSDSIPISNGSRTYTNAIDSLRDISVLANRASVVVYTMDDQGITVPMATAEDDVRVSKNLTSVNNVDHLVDRKINDERKRQSGMFYISEETGGKLLRGENFIDGLIARGLKAETGYYLVSYQPEGDTFISKKYHDIKIRLKRKDLKVNTRSGFFGISDDEIKLKAKTGDSELYDIITEPLPNANLDVDLSAYYANTPEKGNFIHTMMFIDGKDISFVDEGNGQKKAVFDIVAVTLSDNNKVIDDSNHTATVHIPANQVEQVKQKGLIYTVDVPVKKAGVYNFRTALRETTSKRIGSAIQVVEVPEFKKDKLYVSGLIISGVDANGKIYPAETPKADNEFTTATSKAIPTTREFRRRTIIGYAYTIYNPKLDPTTNQPNLTVQTNLYRDGELMSEGTPQPIKPENQTDLTRIRDYSYLRLNPEVPLGDYTLQIIVTDLATRRKSNQSIDFQIVE